MVLDQSLYTTVLLKTFANFFKVYIDLYWYEFLRVKNGHHNRPKDGELNCQKC